MRRAALVTWVGQISKSVSNAQSGIERCAGRVEEDAGVEASDVVKRLEEVERYCRFVLSSSRKLRKVLSYGGVEKRETAHA